MINIQNYVLVFVIILISCKRNNNANYISSKSQKSDSILIVQKTIDIVNPNLSLTGIVEEKKFILNINFAEKDSVFASLYNSKDINPYENIIYSEGVLKNNNLMLTNEEGVYIKGKINESVFIGELILNDKTYVLHFNENNNYSNGNIKITDGKNYKKISLLGLKDSEVCQGELSEIASFFKNKVTYKLLYFTFPSAGLYKARGSCGGGQESLIALVTFDNEIEDTNIEIVELSSCYNGIESLVNNDNFTAKDLVNLWNKQNNLNIIVENLRKDSSKKVIINPKQNDIISVSKY